MSRLKDLLAQEFKIKDLGKLQYFLRIEVARSKKGLRVYPRSLRRNSYVELKAAETPIEKNHKLQPGLGDSVDQGTRD